MSDMKDNIHTILNPMQSGPSTSQGKHTAIIRAIKENEDLLWNDFGDIMMLLTDNYEIGSIYLAIDNSEQCTCYLQKQLECYHKKM